MMTLQSSLRFVALTCLLQLSTVLFSQIRKDRGLVHLPQRVESRNFDRYCPSNDDDSKLEGVLADAMSCIFSGISGAAFAQSEVLTNKYYLFERRFPDADESFFNPAVSWRNKYYDRNPALGRTKLPVQLTDARHMLNSVSFATAGLTGVSIPLATGRRPARRIIFRLCASFVSYSLANAAVHRFYER
jgi:hypothetical protein